MKNTFWLLFLLLLPVSVLKSQNDNQKLFRLAGTWTGTMPCADCDMISYKLDLKNNYTFLDQMTYEGKNVDKLVSDGSWKFLNDSTIEIIPSNGSKSIFRILSEKEIVMLDDKGDPMPAPSPEMFHLKKSSESGKDDMNNSGFLYEEKRKGGVRFLAYGNEPFWSLEIYSDKKIKFTSLTEINEITVPVSGVTPLTDVTGFNYSGNNSSYLINVDVFKDECINDMSGEKFLNRVTISIQGMLNNDMKSFTGCGSNLYDYNLNKEWVMTRFKKTKLKRDDFEKGLPSINFDLGSETVSGNAGCNSFNGKAEAGNNKIKFGNDFITTRMSCPQLDFEQKFLSSLKGRSLAYEISDNKLILKNGKTFLMEFAGIK